MQNIAVSPLSPLFPLLFCLALAAGPPPPATGAPDAPLKGAAVNAAGMELVLVPAGASHGPFYASKRGVTRGQWEKVMGAGGSAPKDNDLPIAGVTPRKAREFCRRLGKMEGRAYGLPTGTELEAMGAAMPDALALPGLRVVCAVGSIQGPEGGARLVHEFCDASVAVMAFPPPPRYPYGAWWVGNEGIVVVEATVDADGTPLAVRAVEGPEALRGTAVEYVGRWRFAPAEVDGVPVAARMVFGLPFRLTRVVKMGDAYVHAISNPSYVRVGYDWASGDDLPGSGWMYKFLK
jgi:TonB family protein